MRHLMRPNLAVSSVNAILVILVVAWALTTGHSATRAIIWLGIGEFTGYSLVLLALGRSPRVLDARPEDAEPASPFDARVGGAVGLILGLLCALWLVKMGRL